MAFGTDQAKSLSAAARVIDVLARDATLTGSGPENRVSYDRVQRVFPNFYRLAFETVDGKRISEELGASARNRFIAS